MSLRNPMAIRRRRRWWPYAAALVFVGVIGCVGAWLAGLVISEGPGSSAPPPVVLRTYVYVDGDFVRRFGPLNDGGGERVRRWIEETDRQMGHSFPVRVRLAGIGTWTLPYGAFDGLRIFSKYVPEGSPEGSGANCMIAITGREGVYWSGVARWPRIFLKAQAAEPIDEKTISTLCPEISHYFGTKDIVDEQFPERTVMSYKDRRLGIVDGWVVWDAENAERMRSAIRRWPST